jgi:hypothetical protein
VEARQRTEQGEEEKLSWLRRVSIIDGACSLSLNSHALRMERVRGKRRIGKGAAKEREHSTEKKIRTSTRENGQQLL